MCEKGSCGGDWLDLDQLHLLYIRFALRFKRICSYVSQSFWFWVRGCGWGSPSSGCYCIYIFISRFIINLPTNCYFLPYFTLTKNQIFLVHYAELVIGYIKNIKNNLIQLLKLYLILGREVGQTARTDCTLIRLVMVGTSISSLKLNSSCEVNILANLLYSPVRLCL